MQIILPQQQQPYEYKILCTLTPYVIHRMVLKKRLPQVVNDVFHRDNSYEDHIFVSSFNFEVPALASPMTHSRKMFSSKQLTQADTNMYPREQILQSHKRLLRGACYHWLERMYYVLIMNVSLFMHSDNHIRLHHSDFQNCTKGHLQIM